MQKAFLFLWLFLHGWALHAQSNLPRQYHAHRANTPITIDGKAGRKEWQGAKWSEPYTDIEGDLKPKPTYQTRMKMKWDEQYLYILAKLDEPHLWATLTQRDAIILINEPPPTHLLVVT